jgi:hypothetical protein
MWLTHSPRRVPPRNPTSHWLCFSPQHSSCLSTYFIAFPPSQSTPTIYLWHLLWQPPFHLFIEMSLTICDFVLPLLVRGSSMVAVCVVSSDERARTTFLTEFPFLPRSIEHVRALNGVLQSYMQSHFWFVMSGFVSLYIFMQSFAIPGTLFLSILAGALFGPELGLTVVSLVASTGSSCCYLLSRTLASGFVQSRYGDWLHSFRKKVNHSHLVLVCIPCTCVYMFLSGRKTRVI